MKGNGGRQAARGGHQHVDDPVRVPVQAHPLSELEVAGWLLSGFTSREPSVKLQSLGLRSDVMMWVLPVDGVGEGPTPRGRRAGVRGRAVQETSPGCIA